jgi:formylglycine-generating enzyme required for sulfatase activity
MKVSIMVNKVTVVLFVVGIGLLCLSSWAWADAAGDYEMLFGQEEKAAVAKGAAASAEFAGRLLNAAKSVGAQKELQALLCEKAYELGIKAPAGYQTAADAMKLLIESAPEKKLAAREKLLKVTQLRYARSAKGDREKLGLEQVDLLAACGDDKAEAGHEVEAVALYRQALTLATMWKSARTTEIMDKIKQLSAAQESERRIASLKARLEKNPRDAAARTALVMAYLGEQDNPAEAVKLLTPDVDEGLRTYVPPAAKKVEELEETVCIQLAEWLLSVSDKSSPADKGILLGRAKACCERYLEVHTAEDVGRLKGKMLLEKVEKAIEKAGGPLPKALTLDLGKGVTMKLILIPAGKFMMGSPDNEKGRDPREGPQREVTITKPFCMGATEVTQAQYEAVAGKNPSSLKGPHRPADQAQWDNAVEFCKKLSDKSGKKVRLPTEAEWEYTCRAGTKTRFSFGDDDTDLHDYAWYAANSESKTHPVGQKKPNAWGLYDMLGNVWEWCSDYHGEPYAIAKNVDPKGPGSGSHHVLRGGSWIDGSQYCRSAYRHGHVPGFPYSSYGFRVVVELPAGQAGSK